MISTDLSHAPLCLAADAAPRAPAVPFPPLSCDCHAHICGPATAFPYSDERIYTPPDATIDAYRHLLAALRVERAVLIQPSVYGTDNRAMLAALAAAGPGFRGVAVVEPTISAREIEALHQAGVRGVRLNLVDRRDGKNAVPREEVRALAARIALFGWHIEFLVNLDEAPEFASAVAGLPVNIVLGHLGYPRAGAGNWINMPAFAGLLRLLEGGSTWVKLTGPYRISSAPDLPYADVDAAAERLAAAAPERLVWGSDWPHVMMKKPMPNDGALADLLTRWIPDARTRHRVLVDNPIALYGFAAEERITR
ncbi:MAG TPA: amidohydrolase family protein [Xanthobacteraceae bacterium]|jgi:predicted TIM-barrel fold metal-dependent hydrolase|nr:amidohydrolase family protein [Xanthobacteraceae bacterium]